MLVCIYVVTIITRPEKALIYFQMDFAQYCHLARSRTLQNNKYFFPHNSCKLHLITHLDL